MLDEFTDQHEAEKTKKAEKTKASKKRKAASESPQKGAVEEEAEGEE